MTTLIEATARLDLTHSLADLKALALELSAGAYTVTGVDADAGATFTYSLTNNASGRFAINATTGVVTVANSNLNGSSYSITVRVTDQGGLTFDKAFTISVVGPVVLDLDGNGVDVVPLPASTVRFDMNADGRPDSTAWAGAADGLLAIDLGVDGESGADGVINQTKEIVFTQWAPGTTSAPIWRRCAKSSTPIVTASSMATTPAGASSGSGRTGTRMAFPKIPS